MAKPSDYLAELEVRSKQRQEEFLTNIRTRLGRSNTPPVHPFRGAPDFWLNYDMSQQERIELFMENWRKVGGEAIHVATMEEAKGYISEVAQTMQARYLLSFDQPELLEMKLAEACPGTEVTYWNPDRKDELLARAAGTDIGIGIVDYAIAHTGTILAMSSPYKGRSISLLPTAFMAVIKAETIKTRMGEVLKEVHGLQEAGEMPAGVHFVTGPSRSADIENDLTIGVHGPGVMYAVVVG
ncbi:LUD domain-containing protein [Ammoniphilus sp. YIM 78166]|uniref:LutC/YkgG family protein n=1 Tax=Ammoniphilus sp. YIM 78166 TaxID=1644106 RepID=UPI00106F6E96|nr:LUD domain-containing protein [Ammoniphilus sp. YIM 78166]